MIPRSDPEFVGWPQQGDEFGNQFAARSNPEFVEWPHVKRCTHRITNPRRGPG